MAKYKVIKEFTGSYKSTGDMRKPDNYAPEKKIFKVGDVIYVTEEMDFGLNKFLASDGFVVSLSNLQFINNDNKPRTSNTITSSGNKAQFIFLKDASLLPISITPNGSFGQAPPVSFKKDEVVDGTIENRANGEAVALITTPKGSFNVLLSSPSAKIDSILKEYKDGGNPVKKELTIDTPKTTADEIFGVKKTYFWIGVGAVALVVGYFGYKKFIAKK